IGKPADIEIGDIAAEVHLVLSGIEGRQGMDARLPVEQLLPNFVNAVTERGYQSHAGNDDASLIHLKIGPSVAGFKSNCSDTQLAKSSRNSRDLDSGESKEPA